MDLEDGAIEGYQNILQEFKENPEYAENSNYLHEAIKQRKWSSDDGSFNVFIEILGAINALGSNESEEVILSLLDSCEDHNVANQLVLTLGFVGGTKSVSKLRDIIFNHDMISTPELPSVHMVCFASCALGRLGDSESVERMIELWNNGYESPFIARAFGLLKDERSISVLIKGTASPKANVVAGSILALSDIGGNEETKHLLYLNETGPIEHILEKNSENCKVGKFAKKQIMASLFLATDRVGEKIGRKRLEKSIETLRKSMGHEFEDWFL